MKSIKLVLCGLALLPAAYGQGHIIGPPVPSLLAAAEPQQNRTYCSLSGRVTTPDGEPLPDATVQLSSPVSPARQALTDHDGHFLIADLPPGRFSVTVARDGFTSVTGPIDLAPEANTATTTFTLRPAISDAVSVSASDKEIADAQVHLEEKQRLAGIIPNFFVSYIWRATPLTSGQKFSLAFKNSIDPGNLVLVGGVAGVQQAANTFPGYSQGLKGYGRRYGADLGNLVAGTFMGGAVLPSIFRQDPRYFYRGRGTVKTRLVYALSRTVITRGDNGRSQFNFSSVFGDLSAGAISNLYYAPEDRQGAGLTLINGFLGIAGDAMNNVFQEFFLKKLTTGPKLTGTQP